MPKLELDTPVRFVRGVGPSRGAQLEEGGVKTVLDVLLLCPSRYVVQPAWQPIECWQPGDTACVAGRITGVRTVAGTQRPSVVATITDGHDRMRLRWFNAPYMRSKLSVGAFICATGRLQVHDLQPQIANPAFKLYATEDQVAMPASDRWRAVYAAVGPFKSARLEKLIGTCLETSAAIIDRLPESIRRTHELPDLAEAIRQLHQPDSLEAAGRARRRLAYDELLSAQLEFAEARSQRHADASAPLLATTAEIDRRIRRRFPFKLTAAQESAIRDIRADLDRPHPMLRLLQGDVGSGKTAVAVYASLVAVAHRRQVALLAPTEILARQHHAKIRQYLDGSSVRVDLVTSQLSAAERRASRTAMSGGQAQIIVGTHALLEPDVKFHCLGVVVIDEQQRFGVEQRAALKAKGQSPHYLLLSATPIPRTQTLAVVGELDMSIMDELPAGRRPVNTQVVLPAEQSDAWRAIRQALDEGCQAYVIFPLIEESPHLQLKAAVTECERLRQGELGGLRCELLHGRMESKDKAAVLERFRRRELDVLVSTTVVEVGIDIPNANMMVVYHPERYGLAQLHQLRGRIARGPRPGRFFMFADRGQASAQRRLRTLVQHTDGFKIAKADLALRGPGELLGTLQHGLPRYKFANLLADEDLLIASQQDARVLLSSKKNADLDHAPLRGQLSNWFGRSRSRLVRIA